MFNHSVLIGWTMSKCLFYFIICAFSAQIMIILTFQRVERNYITYDDKYNKPKLSV